MKLANTFFDAQRETRGIPRLRFDYVVFMKKSTKQINMFECMNSLNVTASITFLIANNV